MSFIAEERRKKFWFGTEQRCEWFATPNRGADVSPTGWEAGGTLLNGGGYQLNSFGSHKNYIFEWPSSSAREVAQKMKSYADGTYGRGLIYFIDPLTWTTNMLPAQWADPSMALGYEGTSLVYGVDPVSVPTSGWEANDLPVNSAYYDLAGVTAGWRGKEQAVFIPIPTGYTLSLGSFHSQSGTGRVYYREQAKNGALGTIAELTPLANNASSVLNTFVSGANLAGVWLYVGKSGAGAGSVTLTAMIGRLIPSVKTQTTMVAQNLFTNPNLVGDGTYATVAENLFPNPNLVGDGTYAEVRRNLSPRVLDGHSLNGVGRTRVDATLQSGFIRLTVNEITLGIANQRASVSDISVTPGLPYTASFSGRTLAAAGTIGIALVFRDSNGSAQGGVLTKSYGADSAEFTVAHITGLAPAWAETVDVWVGAGAGVFSLGDVIDVKDLLLEQTSDLKPFFHPDAPFGSVDPDMRQRWLGAENASESVMEIERVAGLTATGCIAGVSSWEGKPAVRLIPTGGTSSYAYFLIPAVARTSGTAIGTLHLDTPLTGTLNTVSARRVDAIEPRQRSDQPPNEPGSYRLRASYSDLASLYRLRLWHGGAQGSGDVWWTDIGLFAGTYSGGAFSGDTTPETAVDIVQPEDFRWRWTGAANNSTSVMEIERVAGLTGANAIAGVSTKAGKPAVRLVPTSGVNNSYAVFTVPATARPSGVTGLGSIALDSSLSGSLHVWSRRIVIGEPTVVTPDVTPNEPGTYPQRLSQPLPFTVGNFFRLYHGGSQGSGDVWWTDIGLFAGVYDGPAFSGDAGAVVIDGRNLRTQWDGAPDNSTSSAWTRTPDFDKLKLGPWIGGQGHSGCRFIGKPTYVNNTGVDGGQVSFAASFREVGLWVNG